MTASTNAAHREIIASYRPLFDDPDALRESLASLSAMLTDDPPAFQGHEHTHRELIQTTMGPVQISLVGHGDVMVDAGWVMNAPNPAEAVTGPRGVRLAISGHFRRDESGTFKALPRFVSVERRGDSWSQPDPTPTMVEKLIEAVETALNAWLTWGDGTATGGEKSLAALEAADTLHRRNGASMLHRKLRERTAELLCLADRYHALMAGEADSQYVDGID